jgi:hypothetical protein
MDCFDESRDRARLADRRVASHHKPAPHWEPPAKINRIDRVMRRWAVNVYPGQLKSRIIGDGSPEHVHAVV